MERKNRTVLIVAIAAVLLLCCYCVVIGGIGAWLLTGPGDVVTEPQAVVTRIVVTRAPANQAPAVSTPAAPAQEPFAAGTPAAPAQEPPAGDTPEPAPTAEASPLRPPAVVAEPDAAALEEVAMLTASEMPPADPRLLAMRLRPNSDDDIPEVVRTSAPSYKVGDKQEFWVSNTDTLEYRQITAELKYFTDVVTIWVEQGVRMDLNDLQASADRFTEEIYPTNSEFFGSEWKPGVDGDPRLHILHARELGDTVAGYYSSADQYAKEVDAYSNEREMFYISADSGSAPPNTPFYDGILAHEFQHMIHWANDRNETSWVNEGMSELASFLNDFDPGGHDLAYMQRPDTQLTTWADQSEESVTENYGASYLFTAYFLDRFGEELTKAVVASDLNGIAGYNAALEAAGRPERFDDIFADWVIANYLDAPEADAEGRYGYSDIDLFPLSIAEDYRRYPVEAMTQVSQYGVDYIRLNGNQPLNIRFEGQTETPLVPASPKGEFSWWSNRGDTSNSTLTRAVDLRGATEATLTFSAWYEIEEGWDYAYVEASTDGGNHWDILAGNYSSDYNPVGNAFGLGWTGRSGGADEAKWVEESVDLTPYAGQEILIRFEMVTDDAVNKPGLLIDDMAIAEIGWQDDGESGAAGWTSEGWILTDNSVMQGWLVQILEIGDGMVTVERLPVAADGIGELRIDNMDELDEVMVMVSALAPVTTEKANYRYTITRD